MEIPKFDWIHIEPEPGETFANGTPIAPFEISKYPVTNRQYEYFVMHDGYQDEECWKNKNGHLDGDKLEFNRSRWPQPNRPKTNVSWIEARAFCRWWSKHSGEAIQLPHEDHWETAAAGAIKRKCAEAQDVFPWNWQQSSSAVLENNNIADYANVDKNLGQTSTVGLYKQGATNHGVMDMAGNVWEWCDNMKDEKSSFPALRGGSWNFNPQDARARDRSYYRRFLRYSYLGFRVCRLPNPLQTSF